MSEQMLDPMQAGDVHEQKRAMAMGYWVSQIVREIARRICRAPSTISRELRRSAATRSRWRSGRPS